MIEYHLYTNRYIQRSDNEDEPISYIVIKYYEDQIIAYPHPMPKGFDKVRARRCIAKGTARDISTIFLLMSPLLEVEQVRMWLKGSNEESFSKISELIN